MTQNTSWATGVTTENNVASEDRHIAGVVIMLIILCAIFLLSLVGNSMVLYVIGAHLKLKTATNAFIASLSISDLIVTMVCMPMSLVSAGTGKWVFGSPGCAINAVLNSVCGIVSTLMLTCISVDRYIIVVKLPQKPLSLKTTTVIISLCWLVAIIFSLPWHLAVNRLKDIKNYHKLGFHHCMYIFHARGSGMGIIYSLSVIVIFFVIPCMCMVFSSVCLYRLIKQNHSRIKPNTMHVTQLRFSGELRTAKTVVIMVFLFVLCRMLYPMMGIFCSFLKVEFTATMDTVGLYFFWVQCAINPVIYAIRNPNAAQILHTRRSAVYQPDTTNASANFGSKFRLTLCGFGGSRQSRYKTQEPAPPIHRQDTGTCGFHPASMGKDWRSDSVPTVMNFVGLRKDSSISTVTVTTLASSNTTTM